MLALPVGRATLVVGPPRPFLFAVAVFASPRVTIGHVKDYPALMGK
jgi:hypothetical protein